MRKIWDIHGGIHPPENKMQSLQQAISSPPIPPQLILPLSQHIGSPATPIVEVGDTVLKGDCIAKAEGYVSVPIHASSSGTVSAIEERPIPHPSGLTDLCIVIDTDGKDQWRPRTVANSFLDLNKNKLISTIRNAGIAGMGGAGFPSSVKLNTADSITIDTLIINGTECEPYITADHALMRERSTQLAEGIAILAKIIAPTTILVGIEDNKMDVVETVKMALASHNFSSLTNKHTKAEVITFPTKYPSGGEKQLIQILTGIEVPSGGLPSEKGIVCQNMGTAVAIRDAVMEDKPLISRITTMTGQSIAEPANYEILLGTPLQFLLDHCGYNAKTNNRLIMGGPMMGFALTNTDVPIVKTTNCILAPNEKELPTPPPAQACIRCGMCAEACPASLLPQQLFWFSQGKELEKLETHNIADCIECGACSYVCPSHIPLVQYYRASKADIRQRDIDMQHAEQAKQRFDARQERLDRLEAEKIAAKKTRQAKAAANKAAKSNEDVKKLAVAEALARVSAKKVEQKNETPSSIKSQTTQVETIDPNDPIAKALAKRAAQINEGNVDLKTKLIQTVETTEKRLKKARTRLLDAEKDNDENIEAFKNAVTKMENKLVAAQQNVSEYNSTQEEKH